MANGRKLVLPQVTCHMLTPCFASSDKNLHKSLIHANQQQQQHKHNSVQCFATSRTGTRTSDRWRKTGACSGRGSKQQMGGGRCSAQRTSPGKGRLRSVRAMSTYAKHRCPCNSNTTHSNTTLVTPPLAPRRPVNTLLIDSSHRDLRRERPWWRWTSCNTTNPVSLAGI